MFNWSLGVVIILREQFSELLRAAVRPGIAAALGAGVIWRVAEGDLDGAKYLGTFFGIAITFFYTQRDNEKKDKATTDAQNRINEQQLAANEQMIRGAATEQLEEADAVREERGLGFSFPGDTDDDAVAVPTEGKR